VDAQAANGRPAFRFRPSPLRSALGVPGEWRFLSDGSAWTLFIVFRRQTGTTPATRAVLTARAPTGAGFGLYVTDTDRQYWALTVEERPGAEDRGAIVTGMPPPQPQLLDGWRLMVGRHDTGTPDTALTLYSGLTRASTHARSATTSYPRPVAPPSLVVGGAADRRDLDFDGFIAEVVVCGSALDDAARGGITRYLEEKYGLTG
jgi:hypothetical protein